MPSFAEFIERFNVSIDHLWIVAGAFDTLGITAVIDPYPPQDAAALPHPRSYRQGHGAQRPQIRGTVSLPVSGVLLRHRRRPAPRRRRDNRPLNDDVLGRTLDAIAAYGPTELLNEIVAACLLASDYGTHCLHVDTTTFSVSGEYDADFDSRDMTITYGRPKNSQWDRKQFVLGMATDHHGIPLFLQTFSGNKSDRRRC